MDTKPFGKPGGPGLFKTKGLELPEYIRGIAHALVREKGYTESKAIATAIAAVKRWAVGGGDVNADTRAKAAAAVAAWEKARATARATPNKTDLANEVPSKGHSGWVQRYKHGWIPVSPGENLKKHYGDRLHDLSPGNEESNKILKQLDSVHPAFHKELSSFLNADDMTPDSGIYIGKGKALDLGPLTRARLEKHLRQFRRAQKKGNKEAGKDSLGRSVEDYPAAVFTAPGPKDFVAMSIGHHTGEGGHHGAGVNPGAHEHAHALDAFTGDSESPKFLAAQKTLLENAGTFGFHPYFHGSGNEKRDRSEFFAEAYAAYNEAKSNGLSDEATAYLIDHYLRTTRKVSLKEAEEEAQFSVKYGTPLPGMAMVKYFNDRLSDSINSSEKKTDLANKSEAIELATHSLSEAARKTAAKNGYAMPDGSYPIRDLDELHKAIQAYGRAKDKEATKAHIIERAKQLRAEDELPESWEADEGDDEGSESKDEEASEFSNAVELSAKRGEPGWVQRFRHGWIPIDANGKDITDPSKLDAKQRTMLEIQHRQGNLSPQAAKLMDKDGSAKKAHTASPLGDMRHEEYDPLHEKPMTGAEEHFTKGQPVKTPAGVGQVDGFNPESNKYKVRVPGLRNEVHEFYPSETLKHNVDATPTESFRDKSGAFAKGSKVKTPLGVGKVQNFNAAKNEYTVKLTTTGRTETFSSNEVKYNHIKLSNEIDLAVADTRKPEEQGTPPPRNADGSYKLPPGAVGWKHGWIPVDANGNPVKSKQQSDDEEMSKVSDETKKAIASAYQNKAKADGQKAAADKKKADAKAAVDAKKAATAKAQNAAAAVKQAQADEKAGKELTPEQKKLLAVAQKAKADKEEKLRHVNVDGSDSGNTSSGSGSTPQMTTKFANLVKEYNLGPGDYEVYKGPDRKFEDGSSQKAGQGYVLTSSGSKKVAAATAAKAKGKTNG